MAGHVVKLGGSLFDLPDLRERLAAYRSAEMGSEAMLVVGGGEAAESVRRFDRLHGLDASAGHWLAVRAMQLNAMMLAAVLDRVRVVGDPETCRAAWANAELAIMEPMAWLEAEEAAGVHVPHHWQFTSDSIAALAARRLEAQRLTLLKSTLPTTLAAEVDQTITLEQARRAGVVDEALPEAAAGLASVEIVNVRAGGRQGPWPRRMVRTSASGSDAAWCSDSP